MPKKFVLLCVAFLLAGALSSAVAAEREYGLGLRLGTQGLGAEFGVGISERFAVRAGYYTLEYSDDYEETDIVYDGDLHVGGLGAIVDFHPFKNGFRLSAGLFSNDNEVDLTATPTGPQEIGGTIYQPAEIGTLNGHIGFDSTAPYFGLGYGRIHRGKRVGFLFDLGMLKQGSGEASLASSTGLINLVDLEAEIDEIEQDIEDYDFWPVLSFGLAIRF